MHCEEYSGIDNHNNDTHDQQWIEHFALADHVQVYALADQYDIGELKDNVAKEFAKVLASKTKEFDMSDVLEATELLYSTTPQSDRGLRDNLIRFINKHIDDLRQRPDFEDQIRSAGNGDFAVDMVSALAELKKDGNPKEGAVLCIRCSKPICCGQYCMACLETLGIDDCHLSTCPEIQE